MNQAAQSTTPVVNPSFTGEMAVMGKEGDTKIMWDKAKPTEVDVARMSFDKFIKDGYSAYSVNDKGDKKDQVRAFDPESERYIFVPPMQAG
jgi:hypothetical protein